MSFSPPVVAGLFASKKLTKGGGVTGTPRPPRNFDIMASPILSSPFVFCIIGRHLNELRSNCFKHSRLYGIFIYLITEAFWATSTWKYIYTSFDVSFLVIEKEYCTPNPCKNSGICTLQQEGYICSCQPGYRGEICQSRWNNLRNFLTVKKLYGSLSMFLPSTFRKFYVV